MISLIAGLCIVAFSGIANTFISYLLFGKIDTIPEEKKFK
jgi:hypothetical protein